MKIAIFALTRGYPQEKSSYSSLIKRNASIYEHINKFRDNPADIILFHEGNISSNDQKYINSFYPENLIFKDVSQYFDVKDLNLEGEKKFNLGYRIMCRFNMYHVWKELENYDYVLRVDEDIELIDFDPFVFEKMHNNNIIYLTGRFTKDTHRLTNDTLPYFLIENTKLNIKKIYNHKNPYTNLYASSVNFWKKEKVNNLLKKIALSDQQLINRWGDHTVQGLLLNQFKIKISLFKKLEYRHISHNLIIKNNFIRNLSINSKLNPISTTENIYSKMKSRIKGKIYSNNKFDFDS
tara:strand:- start:71 stop:952 length:882 start_codon:yes stop_codon:yes gene_type:complete